MLVSMRVTWGMLNIGCHELIEALYTQKSGFSGAYMTWRLPEYDRLGAWADVSIYLLVLLALIS